MSIQCETTAKKSAGAVMGFFERYLTLWVALCIIAGIGLGHLMPPFFQSIGHLEIAQNNLPVAILLWLMIVTMLLKIDLKALKHVGEHWRGIGVTLFVNWGVNLFQWHCWAVFFWLSVSWPVTRRSDR